MDIVAAGRYSPGMLVRRPWIVVLTLLAFVFARLAGAHLHLCFDGSEPPLTVHMADSGEIGHHAGAAQTHEDVDVDPIDDVVAKSAVKVDLPVLAFMLAGIVLLLTPLRSLPHAWRKIPAPYSPPRYIRPLLRAPPR
jgi:hypothetical protein